MHPFRLLLSQGINHLDSLARHVFSAFHTIHPLQQTSMACSDSTTIIHLALALTVPHWGRKLHIQNRLGLRHALR